MFEMNEATDLSITNSKQSIIANSPLIRPTNMGGASFKAIRNAFPDIKPKSMQI
jgi:hypothetical protein